nr:DNA topoisomerase IV subunit A [Rhodoblastus sp.]
LLEGIDEDSVDFRDNYSGDQQEPIVLPAALPNLLANGAQGIAVGMATSVPPHNLAELCDAALYLITNRAATAEALARFVPGPDFPTGGVIVDTPAAITEIYRTGRGSIRLRARWKKEEGQRGVWNAIVTEIPYGVQKSRLIEKIAELFNEKKLPLVADIRDESAEDIRIVIEPRAKTVDADVMMETLFRQTELEARIGVNMNVLVDGTVPRVVSLGEAIGQWLDHRRDVLLRRSRHRLAEIEHRLELLAGMIIVFLNLDKVIKIIREEDEPKAELMKAFKLTDKQANYVLDTRLRSLRRLEEMELRKEHEELTKEKGEVEKLISDEKLQWKTITWQIRELKKKYPPESKIGKRRTTFAEAPAAVADFNLAEALIEREPVTVVVSEKGWIRALKGHVQDLSGLQFKGDDALLASFFAETTSKILVLASNGKIFTLDASKLPGGRGHGEPIRLMADIDEGADIVCVLPYEAGKKMLAATTDGRGFVVNQDEMIGGTRKGKVLMNPDEGAKAALLVAAEGDHVAVVGQNRKLVVFPLDQVPEMARGKGVRLQRYKDGGIADARVFAMADGLSWTDSAGRVFVVAKADLKEWIGNRADAGRLPPRGFPKNNRFG